MAFSLIRVGSHTKDSYVSQIPSFTTSIPKFLPPAACFCLSLFNMSVSSNPAFDANCLGMISNAFAKAPIISCALPCMLRLYSRRYRLSSISIAPPPGTTALYLRALLTTMIASCRERSASSINCSAPPLRITVADLASGHPVKRLYRSEPICLSSNTSHVPSTLGMISFTEVCTAPPVALATRCKSSSATRPAQNMSRSAKYCVARSPIASRDSTIFAPDATILSSLP
mmetsp:Transcript_45718/g.74573  ORF Transcript_45718/g.74573 Transcript_45718/m.74573 type:complete len:229 (+) Transcript_45718:458-1144(+)